MAGLLNKTDSELIKAIQQGDMVAFERLVKRYQRPLVSFVLKIINNELWVEDIVQETFFKIYKSIDRIDTARKFSTYAFEIAKNTAIDYLRKQKNHISIDKLELPTEESHYRELLVKDNKNLITKALAQIDKKYRQILGLYYFEELSYKEIADKLDIPINTVRTRLNRGKKAMKEKIHEE